MVDVGEGARRDLDASPFRRRREPSAERAVEAHLRVDGESNFRRARSGLVGGRSLEERLAKLGDACEIDREDSDVQAGAERLRTARALARERAVSVENPQLDAKRIHADATAAIAAVVEDRIDGALGVGGAAGEVRGTYVAKLAGERDVERTAAYQLAEERTIERAEPMFVRWRAHACHSSAAMPHRGATRAIIFDKPSRT